VNQSYVHLVIQQMSGQMNIREKNTISERVNQIWIMLMNDTDHVD
jgi:hypothetical protein